MPRKPARSEAEARALFAQHIDIAERMANSWCAKLRHRVELNELRAFAMGGLLGAARLYVKRDEASRFEHYARVRVRGAIRDGLRSLGWFPRRKAGGKPLGNIRPDPDVNLDAIPGIAPSVDVLLDRARQKRALTLAIDGLPGLEREVMRRHYLEGVPFEQIARERGVSPSWISQVKRRAVTRLKEALNG